MGVSWRRRGKTVLAGRELGRHIRRGDVLVVHHYLGDFKEVALSEREQFWFEAEATMRDSVHSEFRGYEFKDDQRRHLLVIDEHC